MKGDLWQTAMRKPNSLRELEEALKAMVLGRGDATLNREAFASSATLGSARS